MKLPLPGPTYDRSRQAQANNLLERADALNRKKGRGVELEPGESLIMRSPDGTRWRVQIQNDGSITTSQL